MLALLRGMSVTGSILFPTSLIMLSNRFVFLRSKLESSEYTWVSEEFQFLRSDWNLNLVSKFTVLVFMCSCMVITCGYGHDCDCDEACADKCRK